MHRDEVIDTILANKSHHNYSNNKIVIITMSTLFWLTVLPLILFSIAFVIGIVD